MAPSKPARLLTDWFKPLSLSATRQAPLTNGSFTSSATATNCPPPTQPNTGPSSPFSSPAASTHAALPARAISQPPVFENGNSCDGLAASTDKAAGHTDVPIGSSFSSSSPAASTHAALPARAISQPPVFENGNSCDGLAASTDKAAGHTDVPIGSSFSSSSPAASTHAALPARAISQPPVFENGNSCDGLAASTDEDHNNTSDEQATPKNAPARFLSLPWNHLSCMSWRGKVVFWAYRRRRCSQGFC
jgi:hypothetical protein